MLSGRIGRAAIVVSACVVLAAGAAGLDRAAVPLTRESLTVWPLQTAGALVAIAALVGALLYRRRHSGGTGRGDPIASSLAVMIFTLFMFALLAILPLVMGTGGISRPGAPPTEQVGGGGGDRSAVDPPLADLGGRVTADPQDRPEEFIGAMPEAPLERGEAAGPDLTLFRRLALILASLVMGILLFSALKQAMALRRPSRSLAAEPSPEPGGVKEVREALRRSVVELAEESPGPGGQITGAYHRLLAVLREAGFPRRPQEAPHEHLHRALVELGIAPEPMRQLTELYVFAEFGTGEVESAHRKAAADALSESLASLEARYPGVGSSAHAGAAAG